MKRTVVSGLFILWVIISVSGAACAFPADNQPVVQLQVKGAIIPIVAGYVDRGIIHAEEQGALCVILMDTPGGLDKSMRDIIQRILSSSVPVVVYVYPEGSRCASAGVYILYSAHVAAMAPSTNLGSAHPVTIGVGGGDGSGGNEQKGQSKEDSTMMEKVTNDAVAYIRSLAKKRGRNEQWAEDAVRKSVNITSTEAAENKVIDFVAKDPAELLKKLKGMKVALPSGEVTLSPSQKPPEKVDMTAVEKFLLVVSDPSIAVILMMLGLSGLAYEFMQPGAILPGVVGGICFILALYSLGSLPINYAGLFLLLFAVILFIADIKAPTHGVLTAGGIISLVLGLVLLIPAGYPYLAIPRAVIIAITVITSAFFIFIVAMVRKTLLQRPVSGGEGMVGLEGIARTELAPEGTVSIEGELWNARSEGDIIAEGEKVKVLSVKGLRVLVKKDEEQKEK